MDANSLGLILTGVVLLIIVLSIVWGTVRGLKKTLFRLAWLLGFLLILLFVTPVLSNWLNGIDISSFNIDVYGPVNKLSDLGSNLLNELAKNEPNIANSKAMISFAENLPAMLINIVVFVVAFWLLKILLWPIWALISSRLFDKQKRERKRYIKQEMKVKKINHDNTPVQLPIELQVTKKKNSLGGAVVGLFIGLMLCCVTFSPLIGLNAVYQNAYANLTTQKEDGTTVSLIEDSIENKETLSYFSCYENSIASKLLTYTGVGAISNAMFNNLATVEVNNEKVYLTDEVATAIKVYNQYDKIKNFSTDNLTQEGLDATLTAVKEIFVDVKESKILYLLGDEVLPYYLGQILNDENFKLIDGAEFDDILVAAYNAYEDQFKLKDLQNQIESLVDVLVTLNNCNLIAPIANGEVTTFDEIASLIAKNVKAPSNFSKTIVDNLYNVTMLKNKYPELVDKGIKNIFKTLNIAYKTQVLSGVQLKEDLKSIIYNAVELLKYYEQSTKFDFDNNTNDALVKVGEILDIVKNNFLEISNYNSLLDFGEEKINNALSSFADFSNIVKSVEDVRSWKDELYSLTGVYKSVIKLVNDNVTFDKVLQENYTLFENVGEGINSAIRGNSKLINNKNIRDGLDIVLNKIDTASFDEVLDIVASGDKTLKQTVLDNIYNLTTNTTNITDWYKELKYNLCVLRNVYPIIDNNFDLDTLSKPEDESLSKLGLSLDKALANTNLVLKPEVIRNVLDHYLKKVEFGTEVDKILNLEYSKNGVGEVITVYDQVLNNIYDKATSTANPYITWQTEFEKIKNVLKANFDDADFVELGGILDNILGSKVLSKSVINTVVKHYIDEEITSLPAGLNNAILAMKNNLNNVVSYEEEFNYIKGLLDVLDATYESDRAKYEALGLKFNEVSDIQQTEGKKSKILTTSVINQFIIYYFDDYVENNLDSVSDAKIIDIVNEIKDNLSLINNYKTELLNIMDLVECVGETIPDKNDDGISNLKDIGYTLDHIQSNIITTQIVRDLISYYLSENTKTITDEDLKAIVNKIDERIKETDLLVNSYEFEFGCLDNLSKAITAATLNYSEIGQVFDDICNINNEETKQSSVFVSRAILNDMLVYFFDDFVKNNLDSTEDADLITVIEEIKQNVSSITSFKTEFEYLDSLFKNINSTDNAVVGGTLDSIRGNSKLITNKNINDIVLYFFDKEAKDYKDNADYGDIITKIRNKIASNTNNLSVSYTTILNEADTLVTTINDFMALTKLEDFTSPRELGAKIDVLEDMTGACDKEIAYDFASIVIDKILGYIESDYNKPTSDAIKDGVVNGTIFSFNTYNTNAFTGSYNGVEYYADLFDAVKQAIDSISG